jgi:hypothetical protein
LQKAKLVNLGLDALCGEWQIAMAITCLTQKQGWSHA